jgi:hypothetical protein
MVSQTPLDYWNTSVTRTVQLANLLSLDLILCLFKTKVHVCTWKMAKDELSAYFASSYCISQAV